MASYGAVFFTGSVCKIVAITQLNKYVPIWFFPCWIACEVAVMNAELYASGRFFPANMHGNRGALHVIKALLWNTFINYLGIFFAPAIQIRHRLMLGGMRFLLWSAFWVPVSV